MKPWHFRGLLSLIWPLSIVLEQQAISALFGWLWRLPEAVQSLPPAVRAVETSLNSQENTSN